MVAGRVTASVVQRQVKYIRPVPVASASGLVAQVYAQGAQETRIVTPPMLLHSPAPDVLAAYWMLVREPLVDTGTADRLSKEAVASAVSVANICPYCLDMHSSGMYDLSTEQDAEAIVADRLDDVADPPTRTVAAWARLAHQPDAVREPLPFAEAGRAELVGVVVSSHYVNRMVNVFLANFLLPPRLGPRARRRLKHGVSWLLGPTLRGAREPGRSLPLLPAAPLPADAEWAAGNGTVAA